MGIISWIIFGLIAGAIAKAILPGEQGGGILMTSALGILGAFVGGAIGSALLDKPITGFNIGSMLIAIVGAILVLLIWGQIQKRRA